MKNRLRMETWRAPTLTRTNYIENSNYVFFFTIIYLNVIYVKT